jgi:hypothetical protein
MTNRQLHRYEMFYRVTQFAADYQSTFGGGSTRAGRAFAQVAAAVKKLSERAMAQLAAKREAARTRAAARQALLVILRAIRNTARIIKDDDPAFVNTFHLPDRQSAQAILTAGRVFARDIEAVAARFIEHELPETLVADLKARLDAYEQAIQHREVGKVESAGARAMIEGAIDSANAAARKLDVLVANKLRDDHEAMAEWERARQVPPRRRKRAVAPEEGPVRQAAAAVPEPPAKPPDEEVQPSPPESPAPTTTEDEAA